MAEAYILTIYWFYTSLSLICHYTALIYQSSGCDYGMGPVLVFCYCGCL